MIRDISHPVNMRGIRKSTKYDKLMSWIGDKIPYSVSRLYYDFDWVHPTRLYEKACRVLAWVPVLWKEADWDCGFMYRHFAYKLERMEAHHREDRVIGDWRKVADEIKVARQALERLAKDDYASKDYKKHYKAFPHKLRNMDKWEKSDNGCRIMPSMTDAERVSFRRCLDLEDALRQSDFELFCKTFTEHSRAWWS